MVNNDVIKLGVVLIVFGGLGFVAQPFSSFVVWILHITSEQGLYIFGISLLIGVISIPLGIVDRGSRGVVTR